MAGPGYPKYYAPADETELRMVGSDGKQHAKYSCRQTVRKLIVSSYEKRNLEVIKRASVDGQQVFHHLGHVGGKPSVSPTS
ncbi:hypothetical protein RvY_16594 [Ramazzottius varieornatus]|uniref:Uncharacterized protein n=1 Tax=Ramazzottius varieornatus TaxID=947166 RepID=A0A1D1W3B2_RAMVA|nr:hypothetical protein RvY_16594 [Ramazzottius varieornatus]